MIAQPVKQLNSGGSEFKEQPHLVRGSVTLEDDDFDAQLLERKGGCQATDASADDDDRSA